jgi:hypothetical protein
MKIRHMMNEIHDQDHGDASVMNVPTLISNWEILLPGIPKACDSESG